MYDVKCIEGDYMSIIIKGMDMPKTCLECRLGDGAMCYLTEKRITNPETIEYFCPLIEIVTCKDCRYWHEHEWYNTCDKHIGNGFKDDYFCADGERKGE